MLQNNKYDASIKIFEDFLAEHPDHVYADRAQFSIAKAHYLHHEYAFCVMATNYLESRYSYSLKLPEALYLRILSYEKMGQKRSAKQTWQKMLSVYPHNPLLWQLQKLFKTNAPNLKSSNKVYALKE